MGRGLRNWHCRSPEPFRVYISLYSQKGLGSGANLPVYTPGRHPVSGLKSTLPRALHFCPASLTLVLPPCPCPPPLVTYLQESWLMPSM